MNDSSRRSVSVENTPTVDGPVGTANSVPSGESANAAPTGDTVPQQGTVAR